jgi:hypothetical protein
MTNTPKPSPLLKAASLWAKSSVKGGQYLTGRLSGMKVLILENRDRQTDDDPSHILYFAEAPSRQGAQERGDGQQRPHMPLTGQRPSTPHRSGVQGCADARADWQAPLHHDGSRSQPAGDASDDMPPWER